MIKIKLMNNARKDVVSVLKIKLRNIATVPDRRPAIRPSTVLFGEICSINFLLPNLRPIS